jgi:hypothetical protein|tara:strand:- start:3150 stop:3374 length:225 start_codon:yes stop_codon:yes gene_type:complete
MSKEEEIQNILNVYMKRLSDEIARSVAYEARINLLNAQLELAVKQLQAQQPADGGNFGLPEKPAKVGAGRTAKK